MTANSSRQLTKQDGIITVADAAAASFPINTALEDISEQPGKQMQRRNDGFQT